MAPEAHQDERHRLDTENRHLREMVTALRDELDRMRIGEQERLQQALAAARDECGQLRGTVAALREQLERLKAEDDERLHTVEQAGRDEAKQLQEMIRVMREKLEGYEKG